MVLSPYFFLSFSPSRMFTFKPTPKTGMASFSSWSSPSFPFFPFIPISPHFRYNTENCYLLLLLLLLLPVPYLAELFIEWDILCIDKKILIAFSFGQFSPLSFFVHSFGLLASIVHVRPLLSSRTFVSR